jgi:hypothetical protein
MYAQRHRRHSSRILILPVPAAAVDVGIGAAGTYLRTDASELARSTNAQTY